MTGLSAGQLALLALAAALTGFSKTSIGSIGAISVAVFAAVLPARASTGALLPLLLVGDLVAVGAYRRHADWSMLWRLIPSVAAGILVGVFFVSRVDDTAMRRTIGAVLLTLAAVHVARAWRARRRPPGDRDGARHHPLVTLAYGLLAGFTTMVANAGGAVMSLYLLAAGLDMWAFLGTAAWFFFLVNLVKVPFSIGLGLLTLVSLRLDVVLAPAILAGALLGKVAIRRLDAARFETLVIAFTAVSSLNLLR